MKIDVAATLTLRLDCLQIVEDPLMLGQVLAVRLPQRQLRLPGHLPQQGRYVASCQLMSI